MAEPRRVLSGPRGHRRLPHPQVGEGARLPAAQGALVLHPEPHLRPVRVREPRSVGAVVAKPRQRALGVRRPRLCAAATRASTTTESTTPTGASTSTATELYR